MGKPILIPHDGTEMSDKALLRAIEMSKALESELIIVHIIDSRFVPPSTILGLIGESTALEAAKTKLIRMLKTGAEAMLKTQIEKARKEGIRARFLLGVGSPGEEIVSIAKSEKAEMIVMGSRQLKGNKLLTLGSVAKRVAETSECPVMIVT